MKRLLITALTALCLLPCTLTAQGYKPTPVSLSQEKVNKDGKVYYAHTVLDHQTLFSISRTYGVSYQDIVDANPGTDLTRGQIQAGQVLLIPQKETPAESSAAREPEARPASAQNTPPATPAPAPSTAMADGDYTWYQPKWYEDLGMIAAKFNVSKEVLMACNGLTSDQIAKRQKLRIPLHPAQVETSGPQTPAPEVPVQADIPVTETVLPAEEQAVEAVDTVQSLAERLGFSLMDLFRKKQPSDRISVAVILPFNAKAQLSHSAFDLYSGLLLAVRDLAKEGIKADLTVIDSKNPATPVTGTKLESCDLVIGPVAPEDLEQVLELCPPSTAVISPLDPKAAALAQTHANFIQAPSSADAQYKDIAEWIRDDFRSGDKVFLIQEKDNVPSAIARYLADSGLAYETLTLSYGEARDCAELLRAKTGRNTGRVVVASEKESFFNEVVRNLSLLNFKGYDFVLYGPSKVRTFDVVEVENLHQANAHLCCSYFIDYDNARIKSFLLSYRALFGAEPSQFAYQGYDSGSYFIRNFATSERERERMTRLEDRKYRGLQSDFLISEEEGLGHVNRAIRRVVYGKDYSITLLNQ